MDIQCVSGLHKGNTVSYTHLDVYKRQLLKLLHKAFKVQGRRLRFCRFFRRTVIAEIRLGIEGSLEFLSIDLSILVQNAVSYTHLDVYKRQVRHLGHHILPDTEIINDDLAVFIRREYSDISVRTGDTERESLSLIHI